MTEHNPLFEMRRLEMLSNTIFGVAMTLLAYDLPRASQFTDVPHWDELMPAFRTRLIALMLSFIIAGLFWFSHHRRLMVAPHGTRGVVVLNLLFLMSIVILPASNGLYGAYGSSSAVATIYGLHLAVIATLNAGLWLIALHGRPRAEFLAAAAPVAVFLAGTATALVSPEAARFVWCLAFGAPFVRNLARRREQSKVQ